MSLNATIQMGVAVVETLDSAAAPAIAAGMASITQNAWSRLVTRNASSTPPVTASAVMLLSLSSGTRTIDLTALTLNGKAVDGTGLKVQDIFFENLGAAAMQIAPGGSNGYELFGAANNHEVAAGSALQQSWNDTLHDVDSTHKNITVTGTGSQQFRLIVNLG